MDKERDQVFDRPNAMGDFKFGENVVQVFDDMVSRSVPFYGEIQRMLTELVADFAQPNQAVYDLGCSTGTTLLNLDPVVDPSVRFVGIDESPEMLNKCRNNFEQAGLTRNFDLVSADLNQGITLESASVAIMCLTLQFVRPLYRERLIQDIYRQLNNDGCLIIVEKVLGEDSLFNRLFIKYYYDMKRRHNYSEMEISQKREALENVLIPYKLKENQALLEATGFRYQEVFFKWYNFCGIIAMK
ncbi:carboxy-S-adenosyl-L-methionine synthase CmoA [Tunicatimonas pelagia]|uniref:carboxy-S-adenosyl-L-methionine synthase CmoA n=1 Tax=Tunicatimonas pelagia TaxID=931531 RepID=UPI00266556D5|nr:carboxy-S-adenosyl-L-methionine synthase CmoA [Tunicatimonas pelagia]WKN42589.1 carboxy-S-adenosyl-L-methionine synthase CmoA [Tunicatimonas pelagia]